MQMFNHLWSNILYFHCTMYSPSYVIDFFTILHYRYFTIYGRYRNILSVTINRILIITLSAVPPFRKIILRAKRGAGRKHTKLQKCGRRALGHIWKMLCKMQNAIFKTHPNWRRYALGTVPSRSSRGRPGSPPIFRASAAACKTARLSCPPCCSIRRQFPDG